MEANSSNGETSGWGWVRSEQSKVQQPVQPRSNTGNRTLAARLAAAPDSPRDQNQTRGADQ